MHGYEDGRYRETFWERWSLVGLIAAAPHAVLTTAAIVDWAQGVFGSPGDACGAGLGMMLVAAPWSLAALHAKPFVGEVVLLGGTLLNSTLLYQWGRLVQYVWPATR